MPGGVSLPVIFGQPCLNHLQHSEDAFVLLLIRSDLHAGANAVALWTYMHHKLAALSLSAASAGALGLFVAANLSRIIRKPLEVICLAPFVLFLISQRSVEYVSISVQIVCTIEFFY